MANTLNTSFDSETFRRDGHQLIDMLADYLKAAYDDNIKVATVEDPEKTTEYWRKKEVSDIKSYFSEIIDGSMHTHHPKYIGHQVSAPLPHTSLAGLVSDLLNNGMGVYEMGAVATAMEKVVIEEFCQHIGFDESSDGMLTSGGTLGNLTALLAARSSCRASFTDGDMYILTSEQSHYCAARAACTMGFSNEQLIEIPVDQNYRLSIPKLNESIQKLQSQNKCIMAIVASSCSTSTGSYDDLEEISKICKEHNIWLHVDGAHGVPAIFSAKYRHLLNGIEHADSIVVDAHKMMMTPALATAVLFKKGKNSYQTFAQKADYLFSKKEPEWYNLAKRTYETTKYMMSIKCFLIFRYYGIEIIEEFIDRQYDLTRKAAFYISSLPNWEIAHFPMSNILCFRHVQKGTTHNQPNQINQAIREQLLREGRFYIVQTVLQGTIYLRITIMNHLTDLGTIKELMDYVTELAKEIIDNMSE